IRKLFPSQTEGERVYLVVREHWVYFALKVFIWFCFFGLYVGVRVWGQTIIPGLFDGTFGQIIALVLDLYLLVLVLTIFILWVLYYLNIQVITAIRIVDVDQVGLFSHTASELNIEKIEDVTSEVNGIIGTVFNYGNVYIQTAGATEHFEFTNVHNPALIQKMVHDLYEKIRTQSSQEGMKSLPHLKNHIPS